MIDVWDNRNPTNKGEKMFGKRKKKKENELWEAAFLDAINYVIWVLKRQSKKYGDTASIKDMIDLISKGL